MDQAKIDQLRHDISSLDMNSDGIINAADLPAILQHSGSFTLSSLPHGLREELMHSLDSNYDGTLTSEDVQPYIDSLRGAGHTGQVVLGSLGDGHGHYSHEQLLLAYSSLQDLLRVQPAADGSIDLSELPVSLRQALLADLDTNGRHAHLPAPPAAPPRRLPDTLPRWRRP